jgi:phage regulator Rha-like protein
MFFKTSYIHPQNKQSYTEYLMNRDGFTLLAMGFNGKKALTWKLKYIAAFNEMEQKLETLDIPSYQIENKIKRAEKWIMEAKELQVAQLESAHKSEVIQGLNRELSLADMRQVLNRIVRKVPNYQARWAELYRQFEMKFHMNLKKRTVKSCSILDYIDHNLDMLPELFEIACKLYEGEVKELVQEIYGVV